MSPPGRAKGESPSAVQVAKVEPPSRAKRVSAKAPPGASAAATSPRRVVVPASTDRQLLASIPGQTRAVVDAVLPSVDDGRFAAKGIAGQPFEVTAHCFADGHDQIRVLLQWQADAGPLQEIEMAPQGNDVWTGSFTPPTPGRYAYGVTAWVDALASWHHDLARRDDLADIRIALQTGALLIAQAARLATGDDQQRLADWAAALNAHVAAGDDAVTLKSVAGDPSLLTLAARYPDRRHADTWAPARRPLQVDRERAGFSAWYELFPRSASPEPGRHGTFSDVEALLPYVAGMGFDVLYFPPIHPVGQVRRKGRNNATSAEEGDVGSPWAIGSAEGGHKAILPQLGTLDDFKRLVDAARSHGIEIALDIAFQCAPDHPYVKEHPQWFRWRPDGTVQYAENPPKKYQDIYPFDFETDDWQALWLELKSVFDHWIAQGVSIFRVDNPHTKAFPFWEWVTNAIRQEHPEVLFLAEAFTRPKVMHRLAKLGYSQSYTYFTWRNSKAELIEYFTELAHGPGASYFRPNVWPNTPDILHAQLHGGRRGMYIARFVLAATLSANYGLYGPAFELLEGRPRGPGSEEYLDSEKYQLRHWDLEAPHSLRGLLARVNQIRRENAALQSNASLAFVPVDNDQLIAFVKRTPDNTNVILTVVNLDPQYPQSGWLNLDLHALGLADGAAYTVHDLLTGQRYAWRGAHNFVLLRPEDAQAHIFRLERDPDTSQ